MKLDKLTKDQVTIVTDTMGPNGRLTILDYEAEALTTKDGYNTAYSIPNPTPIFKLLRQASKQQALEQGDGTTGVINLAYEMTSNLRFRDLKELEKVCEDVKNMLDIKAEPIEAYNNTTAYAYDSKSSPTKTLQDNLLKVAMIVTNSVLHRLFPLPIKLFHSLFSLSLPLFLLFFLFFFFLTPLHSLRDPSFLNQRLNPCPLQCKLGVLTTGQPGKSHTASSLA